jgi:hypothetical protein
MEQDVCAHGVKDRKAATRRIAAGKILISPSNMAHFEGCDHKGDEDFSDLAEIDAPGAWQRLGNGEHLPATGGGRPNRVATSRCQQCVQHDGPWI